jgi:c-di-GMP-binding flagellar brake protein YcgR
MLERRRFHRFEDLPVKVNMRKESDTDSFDAEIADLGVGGIKIRTERNINIYDYYEMVIHLNDSSSEVSLAVKGKAWRIEPDTQKNDDTSRFVALEFVSFDENYRKAFTKFIASYLINSSTNIL